MIDPAAPDIPCTITATSLHPEVNSLQFQPGNLTTHSATTP